ncbi:MAG: ABC-F family ATP-binding cassette domain-containing protein [Chloroflexi bacterium]|nr:ABC-F family ATP-binding cassette domain-containing protein [Chloroflexota bacterium]
MLYAQNLTKEFGQRVLFEDVNLTIGDGERVGLVGPNGAGKSTLLKLMAREEPASRGSAGHRTGTLGYLKQQSGFDIEKTLLDEMWNSFPDVVAIRDQLAELAVTLETESSTELIELQDDLYQRYEALNGYGIDVLVDRVLRGLNFTAEDKQKLCGDFSGGWRMRISLAKLLIHRPDHILLDEPTNHLDVRSRDWLADELSAYPGTVVVVTHEGEFLDKIAQRVVEIDQGELRWFTGNFTDYQQQKAHLIEQQNREAGQQERDLARQERFIERFRAKATKARAVKSREKAVAKISRKKSYQEAAKARFTIRSHGRVEREVLKLSGISHAYDDDLVLLDVDLTVERGQKIVFVGPNGSGKSTLLRIAAGQIKPSEGSVSWSDRALPGYYEQHQDEALNPTLSVFEEVRESVPSTTDGDIRNALAHFLFRGDEAFKLVAFLSGGERSRVALAKFLLQPTNVLLLDEPTNHLDAATRDSLLSSLSSYEGTVICASHDPGLLAIATHVYQAQEGEISETFEYETAGIPQGR